MLLPLLYHSTELFVASALIGFATYYDIHDDKNIPLPLLHFFTIVCFIIGYSNLLNGFCGVFLWVLYYGLYMYLNNGEAEAWLFGGIGFLLGQYALIVVMLAHLIALPSALFKLKQIAFTPYILLSFALVCLGLLIN